MMLQLKTQVDRHFFISAEDDPADVDFEPDSETDKATDKVIYLLRCCLVHIFVM